MVLFVPIYTNTGVKSQNATTRKKELTEGAILLPFRCLLNFEKIGAISK